MPSPISPLTLLFLLCFPLSSALNSLCPLVSRTARASPPSPWLQPPHTSRASLRAAERIWGRSRTHQTALHTSLSWWHSPLLLLAPRVSNIKLKSLSPCLTLINYSLFSIFSSAYWPHHLSPPSLLMTLQNYSMRRLQTSGAPSPPPDSLSLPLCPSLSVPAPVSPHRRCFSTLPLPPPYHLPP